MEDLETGWRMLPVGWRAPHFEGHCLAMTYQVNRTRSVIRVWKHLICTLFQHRCCWRPPYAQIVWLRLDLDRYPNAHRRRMYPSVGHTKVIRFFLKRFNSQPGNSSYQNAFCKSRLDFVIYLVSFWMPSSYLKSRPWSLPHYFFSHHHSHKTCLLS